MHYYSGPTPVWRNIDRLLISSESFKVKESSLYEIWSVDTAFLPSGTEVQKRVSNDILLISDYYIGLM